MLRLLDNSSKEGRDLLSPAFWQESFGRLAELSISFAANDQRRATIYGNANGSVGILVNIKILGRGQNSNTAINLSDEFLRECVGLCSYSTGNEVLYGTDKPTNKGWFYRTKNRVDIHWDFDFISAIDYAPQLEELESVCEPLDALDTQLTQYPLYLSSGNGAELHSFSAWINIPGIEKFNCSKVSTNTPNSNPADSRPGTPFKSQSLLSVMALPPINYADPTNINVSERWLQSEWIEAISDICIRNSKWGDVFRYNGKFHYNERSMLIRPAKSSRFIHRYYNPAPGSHINFMKWTATPLLLRGVGGTHYDLSAVFVDQDSCGVKPSSQYSVGPNGEDLRNYNLGGNDGRCIRSSIPAFSLKYLKLDVRNFRFTEHGTYTLANGTLSKEVASVTVFDEYGNTGNITFSMRDNNWPYLYVNGQ